MARLPVAAEQIIKNFGPHLNYPSSITPEERQNPDALVNTHCCYCGMQCGIRLKRKNNRVVGFEPWYEFPLIKEGCVLKGYSVICRIIIQIA